MTNTCAWFVSYDLNEKKLEYEINYKVNYDLYMRDVIVDIIVRLCMYEKTNCIYCLSNITAMDLTTICS